MRNYRHFLLSIAAICFFSANMGITTVLVEERFDPSIAGMSVLLWEEKAPGVWSAIVGDEPEVTYTTYAGGDPKIEALNKMDVAQFPFAKENVRGLRHHDRVSARIPLGLKESLYGLGLQFKGLNRRNRVFHLRTDHYRDGNEKLHAPVPFYVSSEGYGVLFNTPRFISIYTGVGNRKDSPDFPEPRDRNTSRNWQAQPPSDAVEASVRAEGMEILVFGGPTMLDAVRRYNLYFGGGALPPKWGLGFWHRMRTIADDEEVLNEVQEFNKRDFPLDVIGLEPGWHSKSYPCTFEWDETRFPKPKEFVSAMSKTGVHLNLWENPYVSPDAGMYEAIKPYTGSHTVWLGIVPDFTLPEARAIFAGQHKKEHVNIGVSGYKIDEVDGYDFWLWPDHAIFPSGTSAEEMRQTFALQIQQMLMELFRERNQRTYSLIRASNAGASSYPFAIYTDHYEHKGFVSALVNSSFSGILYTPEIRSARSPEEWVRRMQSVCFSHMVQLNGWASNTKPWSFPEVVDEVREVIKLRSQMLPYFYTAFAKYHYEGTPPIRAMVLEPGYNDQSTQVEGTLDDAKNPYAMAVRKDVTDQYMFGEALLVAPLFTGEISRTVILPQGTWYDFYTGELVGGGEIITVKPPLSKIPLFVKEGGIIPMIPAINRVSKQANDVALEVRHYGTQPSSTMLYDDDGESFNYERGESCWLKLEAVRGDDGSLKGAVSHKGSYQTSYEEINWVFMTK